MNKFVPLASAALALTLAAGAVTVPASAAGMYSRDHGQRDQMIGNYCDNNPHGYQCDNWRRDRGHWRDSDYQGFYNYHQGDFGGAAAGLFGFAVGAAIANSANNNSGGQYVHGDHRTACRSAYRSYDYHSDTYVGRGGVRHLCRL